MDALLGKAAHLIQMSMEVEIDGGFLECIYCGADNRSNDPPEDDVIYHVEGCDGQEVVAALRKMAESWKMGGA